MKDGVNKSHNYVSISFLVENCVVITCTDEVRLVLDEKSIAIDLPIKKI